MNRHAKACFSNIYLSLRHVADQIGSSSLFYDRPSEFTRTGRANAEVKLLAPPSVAPTTVLNFVGLWGGPERGPRGPRVAPTKDASLHLIHGLDLSRAIVAGVHYKPPLKGKPRPTWGTSRWTSCSTTLVAARYLNTSCTHATALGVLSGADSAVRTQHFLLLYPPSAYSPVHTCTAYTTLRLRDTLPFQPLVPYIQLVNLRAQSAHAKQRLFCAALRQYTGLARVYPGAHPIKPNADRHAMRERAQRRTGGGTRTGKHSAFFLAASPLPSLIPRMGAVPVGRSAHETASSADALILRACTPIRTTKTNAAMAHIGRERTLGGVPVAIGGHARTSGDGRDGEMGREGVKKEMMIARAVARTYPARRLSTLTTGAGK
ncbi:hypothetical protein B0H14DRAFT_3868234 [Mycena olivaceomarginata]|nr:hypothetical protein B0H14DRAFT_3868234 [Mycena olivaceomarginata]